MQFPQFPTESYHKWTIPDFVKAVESPSYNQMIREHLFKKVATGQLIWIVVPSWSTICPFTLKLQITLKAVINVCFAYPFLSHSVNKQFNK